MLSFEKIQLKKEFIIYHDTVMNNPRMSVFSDLPTNENDRIICKVDKMALLLQTVFCFDVFFIKLQRKQFQAE